MSENLVRNALVVSLASLIITLAHTGQAAEEKTEAKAWKRARGTIELISVQRRTVAIQVKKVDKRKKLSSVIRVTDKLADDCTFGTKDNKRAVLSDLKVGDEVNVSYADDTGVLVAHRIAQVTQEPGKGKSK